MTTASSSRGSSQHEHRAIDVRSTLATFVSGATAGACSRTLTAPLDRVKIIVQEGHLVNPGRHQKLQAPTGGASAPKLVEVVKMIHADGGWRAFFRGNGVNCMKAGPEFALVFTLRRLMQSVVTERRAWEANPSNHASQCVTATPQLLHNFLIGACAGAGAQLVLYPLEVVKTRIAVSTSSEFQGGAMEVVSEAYRAGGVREFYKGLVPNMVGMFLFRGLEVGLYTSARNALMSSRRQRGLSMQDSQLSIAETAAVGTVASTVAQTATYPLNVVRTQMQTSGLQGRATLHTCGMCVCLRQLYKQDGVPGLFRGLIPNYLKAAPASAITFVVFEQMQRLLIGYE